MSTQKEKKSIKIRESTASSRAEERVTETTRIVTERKYKAHGGLKFHFDKMKLTVPKPFSFDTGPKKRQGTSCNNSSDRSSTKQTNGETTEKGTKIATESLKAPKETRSNSKTRSVSRERAQNGTTKVDSTPKKTRSKDSGAAKSQVQTSEADNSPALTRKAIKYMQPTNASKSREKASNVTKSQSRPKPQVHFSDTKKSEAKVKSCGSSNVSNSRSETSSTKAASDAPNAVIVDKNLQNELKIKLYNEHPDENGPKPEALNGFGGIIHLESDSSEVESPNEISLQSELANAIQGFESDVSKNTSKIPRKKNMAHSEMKFQTNFKKETITELIDFESRSSNYMMENAKSEVNHVQITNVVSN